MLLLFPQCTVPVYEMLQRYQVIITAPSDYHRCLCRKTGATPGLHQMIILLPYPINYDSITSATAYGYLPQIQCSTIRPYCWICSCQLPLQHLLITCYHIHFYVLRAPYLRLTLAFTITTSATKTSTIGNP